VRLPLRPGGAALLAGGAVLAGFAALWGINPHDEGLMLAAADRMARGELPWRDFWWNYGPAEPLMLAGLQELFGRSFLAWRIVHVALASVGGLLAYALVRREAPLPAALAAWLAVVTALSYPLIPNPVVPAVVLALAAIAVAGGSPLLAGVLAGVAVAFRLDVGSAAVLSAALAAWQGGAWPAARRALAGSAGAVLVALVPFVVAGGAGRFLDQTVGFALEVQPDQRLPLPVDYDGPFDLNKIFEFLFPSLVLAAFAAWVALALAVAARRRPPFSGLALAALPLAVAGALYVLARADEFHVVLLQAALPLLAAPLLATEWRAGRLPGALVATVVLAVPAAYGLDRKAGQILHPPDLARIPVDVADGVREEPAEADALGRLVPYVRDLVPPGDPLFVANPRHDLVRAGNPAVYVLVGRANPTRHFVMQPGVVTEEDAQEEMVGDLRRSDTEVVVRWRSPLADEREPNEATRPSGVRILDDFLAAEYESRASFGDYEVLVRRATGDGTAP
jgi:hypothetical protein